MMSIVNSFTLTVSILSFVLTPSTGSGIDQDNSMIYMYERGRPFYCTLGSAEIVQAGRGAVEPKCFTKFRDKVVYLPDGTPMYPFLKSGSREGFILNCSAEIPNGHLESSCNRLIESSCRVTCRDGYSTFEEYISCDLRIQRRSTAKGFDNITADWSNPQPCVTIATTVPTEDIEKVNNATIDIAPAPIIPAGKGETRNNSNISINTQGPAAEEFKQTILIVLGVLAAMVFFLVVIVCYQYKAKLLGGWCKKPSSQNSSRESLKEKSPPIIGWCWWKSDHTDVNDQEDLSEVPLCTGPVVPPPPTTDSPDANQELLIKNPRQPAHPDLNGAAMPHDNSNPEIPERPQVPDSPKANKESLIVNPRQQAHPVVDGAAMPHHDSDAEILERPQVPTEQSKAAPASFSDNTSSLPSTPRSLFLPSPPVSQVGLSDMYYDKYPSHCGEQERPGVFAEHIWVASCHGSAYDKGRNMAEPSQSDVESKDRKECRSVSPTLDSSPLLDVSKGLNLTKKDVAEAKDMKEFKCTKPECWENVSKLRRAVGSDFRALCIAMELREGKPVEKTLEGYALQNLASLKLSRAEFLHHKSKNASQPNSFFAEFLLAKMAACGNTVEDLLSYFKSRNPEVVGLILKIHNCKVCEERYRIN